MKYIVLGLLLSSPIHAMENDNKPKEIRITVSDHKDIQQESNIIHYFGLTASCGLALVSSKIPGEICSANLRTLQTSCTPIQNYVSVIACVIFIYNLGKVIFCCNSNNNKAKRE